MRTTEKLLIVIAWCLCSRQAYKYLNKRKYVDRFDAYMQKYGKDYTPGSPEYMVRNFVYTKNEMEIQSHNKMFSQGLYTYTKGINKFTDEEGTDMINQFTDVDIRVNFKGYNKRQHPFFQGRGAFLSSTFKSDYNDLPFTIDDIESLPAEVDWRTKGVVSPVKDQGRCGSCWAFATTEIVESSVALNTKDTTLLELSPQQLVDCVVNEEHCGGSGGCAGATVELGLDYIINSGGMILEDDLIYEGKDDVCPLLGSTTSSLDTTFVSLLRRTTSTKRGRVASIRDYVTLPTNDYKAVMNAVAKMGPVAVAVDASKWFLYASGVFSEEPNNSTGYDIDHAVVLVGYGTDDATGLDYWLIRNSWGPDWGESGYIRLKRTGDVQCTLDTTPLDGSGCALDENGAAILPEPVEVCGMDGILFDVVVPLGGYLVEDESF